MDLVLEGFDTYLFDPIYASLFPKSTADTNFALGGNGSATFASLKEAPTALLNYGNWEYKPASQSLSFTPSAWAYQTTVPRDNPLRQFINLFLITWIFGGVVYFGFASLSYVFVFDKTTFNHPKYLKNQIKLEIWQTLQSLPVMSLMTAVAFWLEVRGYGKIYDTTAEGPGMWYNFLQFPLFIVFTDFFIYWIHRGLHHPMVYKRLHKPHHKWIMPTPFASHAFHPLDGFAQSVPYHIFPFIFPLNKFAYIALFMFINVWTIMIHDGEYVANSPIINGAACHTMHHLYFNYNYGQFTTLWDRMGGSYRKPNDELFKKEQKMSKEEWTRQSKEMETMVKEVEGADDRSYLPEDAKPIEIKKSQ